MEFLLDHRIENDSILVALLPLTELRLKKDSENPWVLLVPRINNVIEVTDLTDIDRKQLWREVEMIVELMQKLFAPDKINIGALGNIVPQFHFHIICRYKNDRTWPQALWGTSGKKIDELVLDSWIQKIKGAL